MYPKVATTNAFFMFFYIPKEDVYQTEIAKCHLYYFILPCIGNITFNWPVYITDAVANVTANLLKGYVKTRSFPPLDYSVNVDVHRANYDVLFS